jgi:predicted N-acetyltransferase YhbS
MATEHAQASVEWIIRIAGPEAAPRRKIAVTTRVALDLRMFAHLKLRPAASADAAILSQLTEELGYPADPAALGARIERLTGRKDDLLLVCEADDGTVAGWMQAHACITFESGFRAVILGLVVAKNRRRQGIGRLLVHAAQTWAISVGAPVIVVRSNVQREESHAFYPALGFEKTKTQAVYQKKLDRLDPALGEIRNLA